MDDTLKNIAIVGLVGLGGYLLWRRFKPSPVGYSGVSPSYSTDNTPSFSDNVSTIISAFTPAKPTFVKQRIGTSNQYQCVNTKTGAVVPFSNCQTLGSGVAAKPVYIFKLGSNQTVCIDKATGVQVPIYGNCVPYPTK